MIRVLIVDDSAVIRGLWSRLISSQSDMTVTATANNGVTALAALKRDGADIIILDIEMPEMDGLTAIPHLLKAAPAVRIIIASALTTEGSKTAIQALTSGASDYIGKPSTTSPSKSVHAVEADLLIKIRALAGGSAPPTTVASAQVRASMPVLTKPEVKLQQRSPRSSTSANKATALAVGSSTGGPNALATLLRGLPAPFGLPILIVQHMPAYFLTALAQRLTNETGHDCREAKAGDAVSPGRIYLAPGDFHMTVQRHDQRVLIALDQTEPENFCRPAVDPLFRSVASTYGSGALAVVLTGMGEDGREGCRHIKALGGHIAVQDEATSVVWGMPGAVASQGLASAVLPLQELAPHILGVCGTLDSAGSERTA